MRVLGRVRLSRATEESTSVERQREIIQTWADQNGHDIIGWAEDLDISGSVDPFDTPSLGPWLAEDRLPEWDILCSWKLDRLARRAIPLHRLFGLCQDHDKTLVCVSDNIDLSSWVGRLVASVIAGVAEGELEAIRERARGSQRKLRELGRWAGGVVFYGYRPVPREGAAGWVWDIDPHASSVIDEIVEKVLDGRSVESIARDLNDRDEPSPSDYNRIRAGKPARDKRWTTNGIKQLLRNPSMLGHTTHRGQTVRGDDGAPVLKGPALVDPDRYDRVQSALDARSFSVTNRSTGAGPLLGVAFCGYCQRQMHTRRNHSRAGNTYRYYQCSGGRSAGTGVADHPPNIVRAEELEALVEDGFLYAHGDEQVRERVYVRASDHTIELNEAQKALDEITTLLGATTSASARSRLSVQYRALDSRVAELEQLPTEEARWEWQKKDYTYADAWAGADTEARRQMLIRRGVTAAVKVHDRIPRRSRGWVELTIHTPETQKSPPGEP